MEEVHVTRKTATKLQFLYDPAVARIIDAGLVHTAINDLLIATIPQRAFASEAALIELGIYISRTTANRRC